MIICLITGMHGGGRSFIGKKLKEKLRNSIKISAGEIFRKIAIERGYSIEEFIEKLTQDEKLALEIDFEADKRLKKEIEERSKEYDFIIVDSNVAPYYIENALKIFLKTDPEIIAKRVFENRRIGDEKFKSPEDTLKRLVERTRNDIERYKKLSKVIEDRFWKKVYEKAAQMMEILLEMTLKKDFEKLDKYFKYIVDNNRHWKLVVEDVYNIVTKYVQSV